MAPLRLTAALRVHGRWLALCVGLVAQSCVGPDLEPPGGDSIGTPTDEAARAGSGGATAVVGSKAGSGGSSAKPPSPKPGENPSSDADAGVGDTELDAGINSFVPR